MVGAVVALGLWLAGSPADERRRRLDDRRMQDLRLIAELADAYWTRTGTLPEDLEELARSEARRPLPTDPDTGLAYAYSRQEGSRFELCATFALEATGSDRTFSYGARSGFWNRGHPAGRHCLSLSAQNVER